MTAASKIIVNRSDFKLEKIHYESPDLSHLGEYSDTPGVAAKTIDRVKRRDWSRGEFRYFIAARSGKETGNRLSVERDYKRMEAYNASEWQMIGIRASVTIAIPHGSDAINQTLHTPGLWGIESDSDESHFAEVFAEESATLASMIEALGNLELID